MFGKFYMRTTKFLSILIVFSFFACQPSIQESAKPTVDERHAPPTANVTQGLSSVSDFAKFSWVNKRCRQWAADGDIDIDQTCLVVSRVGGGLVVIPNEYNDADFKETLDNLNQENKDKWLVRFYGIGGGEKPKR